MECFEILEIDSHVHWEKKKFEGTSVIIYLKKQIQVHGYDIFGFSNHRFDPCQEPKKTFVCYYKARALSTLAGPSCHDKTKPYVINDALNSSHFFHAKYFLDAFGGLD